MQIQNLEKEYLEIVENILYDQEFLKLKNCTHHGITRYDHSLKVSYQAYQFAKKHHLNYQSVAVGGLLHDFFLSEENQTTKERIISTFKHPMKAESNASATYNINEIEKDIISSHMFPINLKIPKYKESWIVSLYDKKVALKEWETKLNYQLRYSINLALILFLNFMR